jgi:hypothetical protein
VSNSVRAARTRIEHVVVEQLLNFRQETVFVEQISVGTVLDLRIDPTVTNANTLQVECGIATLSIAFNNTSTLFMVAYKHVSRTTKQSLDLQWQGRNVRRKTRR